MRSIPSRPRSSALPLVLALTVVTLFGLSGPPPAGAQTRLDPAADYGSSVDLAPLQGGGFLAVWNRDRQVPLSFGPDPCVPDQIVGVTLDAGGELVGAPTVLLPTMNGGGPPKVAVRPGAGFDPPAVVAWEAAGEGLRIAPLDFDPTLRAGASELIDDCVGGGLEGVRGYDVVAAGDRFWLVWSSTCGGLKIQAQRVLPTGLPSGPRILVSDQALGAQPGTMVAVVGQPDGGFSVAWVGMIPGGRGVVARRFGAGGAPLTDTEPVSPDASPAVDSLAAVNRFSSGGMTVSWSALGRLLLRELDASMEPAGPVREVATLEGFGAVNPQLGVAGSGTVIAWRRIDVDAGMSSCSVTRFSGDQRSDGALPDGCQQPEALASSSSMGLLAAWVFQDIDTPLLCTRPAVGLLLTGDDFPAGPSIADPEFPDFRFHVRIGGDEPNPRTGRAEPLCLPETVCVSGALEGRTEVLLRVVGPRLNHRLWPIIVRFTTSQVEVWIEQLSTGEVEYYLLEGSSPGSEELDGLFDREGFPPS